MERKGWIDRARGMSMAMILLFHTSMYYVGRDTPPYSMYVENALAMFFFLSGYLFVANGTALDARRKLKSIVQKLVVPYLIYTPTIGVLKSLAYGTSVNMADIAMKVLSGEASWFVSSLIVSQLLFTLILLISRGKLLITALLCTPPFLLVANDADITPFSTLNVSFIAIAFLLAGHAFRRYERVIDNINAASYIPLSFTILVLMKVYEYACGVYMTFYVIHIDNFALFLADTTLSSLCLVWLCKHLPSIPLLEYTGSHSLIYYFICGGVPLIVGRLMPQYADGRYLMLAVAFIIVYLCSTAVVWAIYKWLPWTTGEGYNKLL